MEELFCTRNYLWRGVNLPIGLFLFIFRLVPWGCTSQNTFQFARERNFWNDLTLQREMLPARRFAFVQMVFSYFAIHGDISPLRNQIFAENLPLYLEKQTEDIFSCPLPLAPKDYLGAEFRRNARVSETDGDLCKIFFSCKWSRARQSCVNQIIICRSVKCIRRLRCALIRPAKSPPLRK